MLKRLKFWWLERRLHASYRRWDKAFWRCYQGLAQKAHLDAASAHLKEMVRRHEAAKEAELDTQD